MTTTVNSAERIFAVFPCLGATVNPILCNLSDLENVATFFERPPIIRHFWNGRLTKITKLELKEMLKAHGLNSSFII